MLVPGVAGSGHRDTPGGAGAGPQCHRCRLGSPRDRAGRAVPPAQRATAEGSTLWRWACRGADRRPAGPRPLTDREADHILRPRILIAESTGFPEHAADRLRRGGDLTLAALHPPRLAPPLRGGSPL